MVEFQPSGDRLTRDEEIALHAALRSIEALRRTTIQGAAIDLGHETFNGAEWAPLGIGLRLSADQLAVSYSHPNALGVRPGLGARGPSLGPHVVLRKGESLRVVEVQMQPVEDVALRPSDQRRAIGYFEVSGPTGPRCGPWWPITFADPYLIEVGPNAPLLNSDIANMRARFFQIEADARRAGNQQALAAVAEARRHLDMFLDRKKDILEYGDDPACSRWMLNKILQSHDSAAAFGWAVARAEAELMPRLRARNDRGNRKKGAKKAAEAKTEWHGPAEPIAVNLRRANPAWKEEALAHAIIGHADFVDPEGVRYQVPAGTMLKFTRELRKRGKLAARQRAQSSRGKR